MPGNTEHISSRGDRGVRGGAPRAGGELGRSFHFGRDDMRCGRRFPGIRLVIDVNS